MVEDGLREYSTLAINTVTLRSLNPCCGGRWSQREVQLFRKDFHLNVLILVVVEDGLRVSNELFTEDMLNYGLNPCCGGRWSQRNYV